MFMIRVHPDLGLEIYLNSEETKIKAIKLQAHFEFANKVPSNDFPRWLQGFIEQVTSYFEQRPYRFSWIYLDMERRSAFEKQVYMELMQVSHGETISYAELAEKVGSRQKARAVGRVMARNPFPIVIPCHRVLASNGTLGGYAGGLALKQFLLELEEARLSGVNKNESL